MGDQEPTTVSPAPLISPETKRLACAAAAVATVALTYTLYWNIKEGRQDLIDYWRPIMGNVGL